MERNHLLMLLKLGKNYRSFTSRNYQAYAISYAVRDWLISCIQLKFSKKLWKKMIEVWVQVRADIRAYPSLISELPSSLRSVAV